jgi:hypothetical protein
MTSRKEYYASRDASKVYQSVSKCIYFIVFLDGERVPFLRFPMIYLHPQASTKGFQEKDSRRIGDCSQHSCYSPTFTVDPSVKSLVEAQFSPSINRDFNDYKILFITLFPALSLYTNCSIYFILTN